jgi:hypothetical protein
MGSLLLSIQLQRCDMSARNTHVKGEHIIKNKKFYIILAVVLITIAASAFVGGRMLNRQVNLPGNGGSVSTSISMIPAPELPTGRPEAVGTLVGRKDNTITVQPISVEMNSKGAGVVRAVRVGTSSDGTMMVSPSGQEGPKVEVIVTNQTIIYHDVTEMSAEQSKNSGATPVQQVVEIGSLDDLKSQSMIMVMVWGRKNGDRIIADVISYSAPVLIQK